MMSSAVSERRERGSAISRSLPLSFCTCQSRASPVLPGQPLIGAGGARVRCEEEEQRAGEERPSATGGERAWV